MPRAALASFWTNSNTLFNADTIYLPPAQYALLQQPFILTLTGHEPTAARASGVVSQRLAELGEVERSCETGDAGRDA